MLLSGVWAASAQMRRGWGVSAGQRRVSMTGFLTVRVGAALLALGSASVLFAAGASASANAIRAGGAGAVRVAQVFEAERTGVDSPGGLAFSPVGDSFYVVEARRGGSDPQATDIATLRPFANEPYSDRAGSARIAAAIGDPVNMAFDARHGRLLFLDRAG